MKKITILLAMLFIATISFSQTVIYTEDFESGGADWTDQNLGDGDTLWAFDSMVVPGGGATNDFPTLAATFDDDAAADDGQHDYRQLWHGPEDVSTYGNVILTYDYAFNVNGADNNQLLHISLWDNTNSAWINIKTYGVDTDPTTDSIDVSAAMLSNPGIDPNNLFFGFGYDDIDAGWDWGAGIDNVILSGNVQPVNDSIFIHTATAANIGGHITTISHPDLDGNPGAQIIVTHNWNPGGTGGIYNDNVDGVWYDGSNWTIFNEDITPMVEGASFNIYIAGNDSNVITHVATVANQNGNENYSYIDNPNTNGNPNANLVIDNYWNPNSVYNVFNYGLFYDTTFNQWVIYSENLTAIPVGAAYNVIISPSNNNVETFRHEATAATNSGNITIIDNVLLNGKPNAVFVFSHNWGSGGDSSNVIVNKTQAVWYNGSNWSIYNEDLSSMDDNSLYNIVVMNSEVAATNTNELINFTIYPNPVKNNLTIDSQEEITKIEIYNLLGQQVKSSNPKATNFTMDLSELNAGIYMVKIISNDKHSSQKIIKQ